MNRVSFEDDSPCPVEDQPVLMGYNVTQACNMQLTHRRPVNSLLRHGKTVCPDDKPWITYNEGHYCCKENLPVVCKNPEAIDQDLRNSRLSVPKAILGPGAPDHARPPPATDVIYVQINGIIPAFIYTPNIRPRTRGIRMLDDTGRPVLYALKDYLNTTGNFIVWGQIYDRMPEASMDDFLLGLAADADEGAGAGGDEGAGAGAGAGAGGDEDDTGEGGASGSHVDRRTRDREPDDEYEDGDGSRHPAKRRR